MDCSELVKNKDHELYLVDLETGNFLDKLEHSYFTPDQVIERLLDIKRDFIASGLLTYNKEMYLKTAMIVRRLLLTGIEYKYRSSLFYFAEESFGFIPNSKKQSREFLISMYDLKSSELDNDDFYKLKNILKFILSREVTDL